MTGRGQSPGVPSRLTAIILYYRLGTRIFRTIDALRAQLEPGDHVLVIDNNSGDGVLDAAPDKYANVTILRLLTNLGYAGAMNLGIAVAAQAGSELVLLLTHECVVRDGAVSHLRKQFAGNDRVGLAGPLLLDARNPTRVFSAGGYLDGSVRRPEHRRTPRDVSGWEGRPPERVDWLDGACLMARVTTFLDYGGFDERYFLYCEDVDLAVRITGGGLDVVVVPAANAEQDTAGAPPYFVARNRCLLARTHDSRRAALTEAAVQMRHATGEALAGQRRPDGRARARGVVHYLLSRYGAPI